jgi:hypothetical protein
MFSLYSENGHIETCRSILEIVKPITSLSESMSQFTYYRACKEITTTTTTTTIIIIIREERKPVTRNNNNDNNNNNNNIQIYIYLFRFCD